MRKLLFLGVIALAITGAAFADPITFTSVRVQNPDGGSWLEASASFEISGSQLIVTMANISSDPAARPSDLLTGIFFDLANENALTPVSAEVVGDWRVLLDGEDFTDEDSVHPYVLPDVGGEFAYEGNISSEFFQGARYGIASAGLDDYFGPNRRFNSNTLWHPDAPNGMDFGMASAVGLLSHGGMNGNPIIVGGAVEFTFNYAGDLSTEDISNVNWQYGTSASNPNITVVPEPTTVTLLGLGIAGLLAKRRFRKKA